MLSRDLEAMQRRLRACPEDLDAWTRLARWARRLDVAALPLDGKLLPWLLVAWSRSPRERSFGRLWLPSAGLEPDPDSEPGSFWRRKGRSRGGPGEEYDTRRALPLAVRHRSTGMELRWVPAPPASAPELLGYFVGRYPVRVREYQAFLEETGHRLPVDMLGRDRWELQRRSGERPVVLVSCEDARAFGRWAGGLLPDGALWSWAARGPAPRRFPWGSEKPDQARANFNHGVPWRGGDWVRYLAPASGRERGEGPFGLRDMAGNVREWTEERVLVRPPAAGAEEDGWRHVLRGGSWGSSRMEELEAENRDSLLEPSGLGHDVGFRLAIPVACATVTGEPEDDDLVRREGASPTADPAPAETEAKAAQAVKVARVIKGRYEPRKLLGKGAMGEVFLCRDHQLDRDVAVKAVRARWAGEDIVVRRFMREARIMASIEHPHLVQVYDIDEENGIPFLAMEHVDGPDLSQVMERRGRLPLNTVLRIASEVGGALDALHEAGVGHRDVKPANILVRRRDHSFVLMDLGLAADRRTTGLTKSGQLIGTPRYMPPELLSGAKSTPASDIFQLGVVLFEALTGVHMVPGRTLSELGRALRRGTWAPFPSDLEGVSEDFKQALRKATALDPSDRYGSCAEMVEALSFSLGMMSSIVPASRLPTRPPPPGRSWIPVLAPLILGASMAVGYFGARYVGEPRDVRWRVLGDALVADFEAPESLPVWMEVNGAPVEAINTGAGEARRLLYRGLVPGREVRARLAWSSGREPEADFTGEAPAVGGEVELAEERGLLLQVRRPVTARWEGGKTVRLERGKTWIPGPPEGGAWRLHWKEGDVEFSRQWIPTDVLDEYVNRMEDRVRRIARSGGDRVSALQQAWARSVSWVPTVLSSELPEARRRRYFTTRENSDRQAAGSAWRLVQPDQAGGRSYPRKPDIPSPKVSLVLTADRPPAPEVNGYAMFTNANELYNRAEFNVPAPLRFQWPTIPDEASTVSLWLHVAKMDAGGQIRLRTLGSGKRHEVHLFSPVSPGRKEERYTGWLRLVLPRDLCPAGGAKGVAELITRDRNHVAGFFMAYLRKFVVSWTMTPRRP